MAESSKEAPGVSRGEFDTYIRQQVIERKQVSDDIAGLASAIREEGVQRQADNAAQRAERDRATATLRTDIKELARHQGKPQWQGVGMAISIGTFMILLVGGIIGYMNEQLREVGKELADARVVHQGALIDKLEDYDVKQDEMRRTSTALSKEALLQEINSSKTNFLSLIEAERLGSVARHDAQDGQIKEIQRRLIGVEMRERAHTAEDYRQWGAQDALSGNGDDHD